jgi:hypothetical protein
MMSPSPRLFVVALCLVGVAETSARQATNTARLSGVVVTNESAPQPIRRAIVTIGGESANGRSAVTDDQGRFAFAGLPPGRFTLTAAKAAHITTAYGAKGPGRPGTPISLGVGQAIANLTLVLPHGASVSGIIRDQSGEPASTVQVLVMPVGAPRAAISASNSDCCLTDDRGMFRAFGLAPGTYIVAAVPRLIGLTGGMRVMSSEDVDAAFREQQLRTGRGANRLSGGAAAPATAVAPASKLPEHGYMPIFYPGTPVSADATRLTLRAGEDREGVDLTLDLVTLSTVEGRVVTADGVLPELNMNMSVDGPSISGLFGMMPSLTGSGAGRTGINGSDSFQYTNVAPGHYTIFAQTSNTKTTVTAGGFSTARLDPGTVPMLWGSAEIDVTGADITGVTLQLQPAMTFSGRVTFNGASLTAPENLASIRVALTQLNPGASGAPGIVTSVVNGVPTARAFPPVTAAARADGTFDVTGVMPGRYTVGATLPGAGGPTGWWLRSAIAGGRDLLDAPIDIGPGGSISEAVLTFTDRHTEIAGALQAGAGQPAPDFFVIVFPSDPTLRRAGSRRVKTTRPASDGHFSFADLPAGEYTLAALTDVAGDEWQAPEFLDQVVKSGAGVKVALGEGEKKTQNLQISGR